MMGGTQALVGCGMSLLRTPHPSSANHVELSHPSRFLAAIRGVPNIRLAKLRSPKVPFGLGTGLSYTHEKYPGFMYEKIAHQSNDVVLRQGGRLSPAIITKATASASEAAAIDTITFASWSTSKADLEVLCFGIATIVLATANKILYKMALVPMKQYPFFLAQLNTFGYVLVYFAILYGRYKAGFVTDDMLSLPKGRFVALGALEALALATGMAAAGMSMMAPSLYTDSMTTMGVPINAVLPAASIPVLLQVFLVWSLILSAAFLGKRYTKGQIAGCLLVVVGVIIVVASGTESLQQTGIFWPVVMIISSLFSAGGSILKESIFTSAKKNVKGGNIDLFVVNSFGSGFQALFVLCFLPFLSSTRGIPFDQLGSYFRDGSACFFNVGSAIACEGSPFVPLLYVVANMAFNIVALYLMKISSAILSCLCITASVPLAIFAFTLPLPLLGAPPPLPPKLFLGSAILCIGLAAYNLPNPKVEGKLA